MLASFSDEKRVILKEIMNTYKTTEEFRSVVVSLGVDFAFNQPAQISDADYQKQQRLSSTICRQANDLVKIAN